MASDEHELTFHAVDPDLDWSGVRATCSQCGELPGAFQSSFDAYRMHNRMGQKEATFAPGYGYAMASACRGWLGPVT